MSMIAGVQAYAKCSVCSTVMWTTDSGQPDEVEQCCTCPCGSTHIHNDEVTGNPDQTFVALTMSDLENAEASNP